MTDENPQFSPRYSFYDLTGTSNKALLEVNRQEARKYLPTLRALAQFLEILSGDDGRPRLSVNSAFRCAQLNGATPGSSSTSQHPMGQAADVTRAGQTVESLFAELRETLVRRRLKFGQLIFEEAKRDYGVAKWVHASLGLDYWKPERCGEVRTMRLDVKTGKPVYTLVEVIKPWEAT